MRDSRRKAETHHGSDPTTEGTPGTGIVINQRGQYADASVVEEPLGISERDRR